MIILPAQVDGAIITMDRITLRRIHTNTTMVRLMLPATLSIQLKQESQTTKSNNIEIDETCPHPTLHGSTLQPLVAASQQQQDKVIRHFVEHSN